jgi:hypothetical protein
VVKPDDDLKVTIETEDYSKTDSERVDKILKKVSKTKKKGKLTLGDD